FRPFPLWCALLTAPYFRHQFNETEGLRYGRIEQEAKMKKIVMFPLVAAALAGFSYSAAADTFSDTHPSLSALNLPDEALIQMNGRIATTNGRGFVMERDGELI